MFSMTSLIDRFEDLQREITDTQQHPQCCELKCASTHQIFCTTSTMQSLKDYFNFFKKQNQQQEIKLQNEQKYNHLKQQWSD